MWWRIAGLQLTRVDQFMGLLGTGRRSSNFVHWIGNGMNMGWRLRRMICGGMMHMGWPLMVQQHATRW